jgi:hypothetical protein
MAMSQLDHHEPLVRAINTVLDEQIRDLDAASLSKLNRARQRAIDQVEVRHWWQRLVSTPLLAFASIAAFVAVGSWMLYRSPQQTGSHEQVVEVSDAELELLWEPQDFAPDEIIDDMAADDADIAMAEELDFYAWLAVSEPAGGS